MAKKKGVSLYLILVLTVVIPVLISGVLLSLLSISELRTNMEDETRQELEVAAIGLCTYYENSIMNGEGFSYGHDYVDRYQQQGVELTVFDGDVRLMTSIKDASGNRIEGTPASAEVWGTVKAGNEYHSDDVKINGRDYYVYYLPVYGPDGDVIGMAFSGKACADVDAAISKVTTTSLLISGVLILVFAGVGVLVGALVAKPLSKVARAVGDIAAGDLSDKEKVVSPIRETSEIADAQVLLQDKLSDVMRTTRNTSDDLIGIIEEVSDDSSRASGEANQINSAMEDLAQGATSMATSVQDLSAEVVEIADCVSEMVSSVKQLTDSSDAMREANDEASSFMGKVAEASEVSVEAVNAITRQIEATNRAIEKIDEAVVAIMDIASQTNLLALNASIEAARAGEAGRGFAVVAGEINNLSTQSNASAKEISDIVSNIKEQSKASVSQAIRVKEIIEKEQTYVEDTNEKFTILNSEIGASVDNIRNIGEKVETLEQVKNRITSNVEDLSAVSEENAASNEEVSASLSHITEAINGISSGGSRMTQGALDLQEAIAYFKI